MNWKIFFIKFLRNIVISVILSVVVLGGFGYLLAGKDGLINMTYWGIVLGLIGGFSAGIGMIFQAEFWGVDGNYKLFPEWVWFIKQSKDDENKSNY